MKKKILVFTLALLTTLMCSFGTGLNKINAASISFKNFKATNVSATEANLSVTVSSNTKQTYKACEFRINKVENNNSCPASVSWVGDTFYLRYYSISSLFNTSKYGYQLTPNTKYVVQFRVLIGSSYYYSEEFYFYTSPQTSFKNSVSDITSTNASLHTTINFGKTTTIKEVGVCVGLENGAFKNVAKDTGLNIVNSAVVSTFNLNKYGVTLAPGTTYKYYFYAVTSEDTYMSGFSYFQTYDYLEGIGECTLVSCYRNNKAVIDAIGKQTSMACSVYALAYARGLLDGQVASPSRYWVNGQASWSAGNYKKLQLGSYDSMVSTVKQQLDSNLPVIIHINGVCYYDALNSYIHSTTKYGHWVTVIGFTKNGEFIAVDPGTAQATILKMDSQIYDNMIVISN